VVGYDLTQLLVGSEGTLAIITQIILRLIPKPPAVRTLRATFPSVTHAVDAVAGIVRARVVPAALELMDADSLAALVEALGGAPLAPPGTAAILLIEVDGLAAQVAEEADRVVEACREAGALDLLRATTDEERAALWQARRDTSLSLKRLAPLKFNHDVVVPKARIPELFALINRLKAQFDLRIPAFGHVGDGNIHVNLMIAENDPAALARVRAAELELFRGVVALEGSISGEHGIGFSKMPYLGLELSPDVIALMRRVKAAFDPAGILNPGKIFEE
jgi:glycolate oxidase